MREKKFLCDCYTSMWLVAILVLTLLSPASSRSARSSQDTTRRSLDGVWSNWTISEMCTVSCGGGFLLQTRVCSGSDCSGQTTKISTLRCNTMQCPFSDYQLILNQMNIETALVVQNFSQSLFRLAGAQPVAGFSALSGFFDNLGICSAVGDPHYQTFDGWRYDYYTSCRYYAVYDRDRSNPYPRFSVVIETGPCGNGVYTCVLKGTVSVWPCDASSGSATSSSGTTYDIYPNGVLLRNGQDITSTLPDAVIDSLVTVSRSGGQTTLSSFCHGIEVRLIGYAFYVTVSSNLRGQVLGLCGTFDGNPSTDATLMDGKKIASSLDEFVQDYQLPSQGSGCVSPPLPPSCSPDDSQPTQLLCDAMNRGGFALCSDSAVCSSPKTPVAPKPYIDNCIVDVCECAPPERERCACSAYILYAIDCTKHCSLQIDLTKFPGCEVPVVRLTPTVKTVWQGYPAKFQCSLISGYPVAPFEFSLNGKDVDTMSNVTVNCTTPRLCTLNVYRAIAGKDNGTIRCLVNNVVGEDSETSLLTIRVGSFSVKLSKNVLVGSRTIVRVRKTPTDNPVQNVQLKLVTLDKTTVAEIDPSIPSDGIYLWEVTQLPLNAKFDTQYRLKVYDSLTEFEGYSSNFTFIRDTIIIKVPINEDGAVLDPPLTYLGRTTLFSFQYSYANIFMQNMTVTMIDLRRNVVERVGNFSAPRDRWPNVVSWIPGTFNDVPNNAYHLYARDLGTTGAEGTSPLFTVKHGSLCIIPPRRLTYGTVVSVFGKEEPKDLPFQLTYKVVQANDCAAEVADVTDEVRSWPHATWRLTTVLPNVGTGQQYRLSATSSSPSYLQTCSDSTFTFATGRITVRFRKNITTVYIDHSYAVKFSVPSSLVLVKRVSVNVHCSGFNRSWTLRSSVDRNMGTIWWNVGQEEIRQPVQAGRMCFLSVSDVGKTGASGWSQDVEVARACVSTDTQIRTAQPMEVGVLFRQDQKLSHVSVALVNTKNTSEVMLSFLDSEVSVQDNMLTIQNARVPALDCRYLLPQLLVRVYYPEDMIAGFSDPVTFQGWSLNVNVVNKDTGAKNPNSVMVGTPVSITASVPEELLQLVNFIEFEVYVRNTSGCFPIPWTPAKNVVVKHNNCSNNLPDCFRNYTFDWIVGNSLDDVVISEGNYTLTVRDKVQNNGTFLVEGQSKEFDITPPAAKRLIPESNVPRKPQQQNSGKRKSNEVSPATGLANATANDDSNGPSDGAVAGIVVVCIFVAILLVLVVMIAVKRYHTKNGRLVHGRTWTYQTLENEQSREPIAEEQ